MKLGFYDSGLGGLSVLKEFVDKYQAKYSYVYFGDSARAPYGEKSPEQLKSYVLEIAEYMEDKEVDVLISACNSSSMYLDQIDFDDYFFQLISLNNVILKYFTDNKFDSEVALLATKATIDSRRYEKWPVKIYPLVCPDLVPLIEAGNLDQAKARWSEYIDSLPVHINDVIIGCTHFSFLTSSLELRELNYIDPAKLVLEQFAASVFDDGILNYQAKENQELDLNIHFSKANQAYLDLAMSLIE